MKLYLGFDGSYVISRQKLRLITPRDRGSVPFLNPIARGDCITLEPREVGDMFRGLKLKKYEVVQIELTAKRVK